MQNNLLNLYVKSFCPKSEKPQGDSFTSYSKMCSLASPSQDIKAEMRKAKRFLAELKPQFDLFIKTVKNYDEQINSSNKTIGKGKKLFGRLLVPFKTY